MVELNKFLMIFRRRAWLLAVGLVVGLVVGFVISSAQQPTYEASTKLLVSNQLQGASSNFAGLTNQQLVLTYVQMLKTQDLTDKASQKAGIAIQPADLTIQQVQDTQIIEVKAQGNNADEVALVANTMADTLLEQIETVRSSQFIQAEKNLTDQIEQAKQQMATLQKDYDQTNTQIYQDQLTKVEKQISDIQTEIATLKSDMIKLSVTPTIDNRIQIAQKDERVSQLESSYKLYDDLRANLVILGKATPTTNPADDPKLQQIKATIALYQKIYTDLLSNLEATQLSQSQQSPNVLQIQKAFPPASSIAPVRSEYTLFSGVAGLILAVIVVILLEIMRESLNMPEAKLAMEARK